MFSFGAYFFEVLGLIIVLGLAVFTAISFARKARIDYPDGGARTSWFADIHAELVGALVTGIIFLVSSATADVIQQNADAAALAAEQADRRDRLFVQMRSTSNIAALLAVEELRFERWLEPQFFAGRTFDNADLRDADLAGYDMSGASSFSRVSLSTANLVGANMSGLDMNRVDFAGASMSRMNLSNAVMTGVNLTATELNEANLANTDLGTAIMDDANVSFADLSNTNLFRVTAANANFERSNLSGVNLLSGQMPNANLTGAVMTGADISAANLSGANLNLANLQDVNATNADLRGANLERASLLNVNLTNTRFDETVILPDGRPATNAMGFPLRDEDGNPVFSETSYWTETTDMTRYTDPTHPDFWRPDWASAPEVETPDDPAPPAPTEDASTG